jgi:hypothetical protein
MDFKSATDCLFECVSHEELARALDVSVATVRQARLTEGAKARRKPPNGWESAVAKIAASRSKRLAALATRLERQEQSGNSR